MRRLRRWRRAIAGAVLALAALICMPTAARADEIRLPRDLVQMPADQLRSTVPPLPSDYTRLRVGTVEFAFPPRMREQIRAAMDRAPADIRSIANQLGLVDLPNLEVRFVPDPDTMARLAPRAALPPSYAVGVAYPSIGLTLVSPIAPGTGEVADLPRVLRHELSHLLLGAASRDADVPRWFSEGLAIQHAAEHSFTRFRTLAWAGFTGNLPPLAELDRAFADGSGRVEIAYAQAADFVDYLMRRENGVRFPVLIAHLREGLPFEQAIRETYDRPLVGLDFDWRSDVRVRFLTAPLWAGTGFLWIVAAILLVVAASRRRRQGRETIARWEAEAQALAALQIQVISPGLASATGPVSGAGSGTADRPVGNAFTIDPNTSAGDVESDPKRWN